MPFSSLNFLFILPVLLLVYWFSPKRMQHFWLLVAGAIVYMYAGWEDLALLLGVTWMNWVSHRLFPKSKGWRTGMILADVGVLLWFKYRFFLGGMMGFTPKGSLIIPLGISFYIFQLISYQVEIMQGVLDYIPTFQDFFLYIFFFPHHQAGPIMRPHAFLICFTKARSWFRSDFVIGLLILLWGLAKKVWIADMIAPTANHAFQVFHDSGGMKGNVFYLSVVYGVQIYADFSGYSDIAVGLGRLFGFKLDRNFHQPYTTGDPSTFWNRWHITLSHWLRDYVYIPLGGNRGGKARTLFNLMAVMVVGGMWHGAGWCFLLWGFMHGLYLVVHRVLKKTWVMRHFPAWFSYPVFQVLVMLTWLPFRETSVSAIWRGMTRLSGWTGPQMTQAILLFAGILAFSHVEERLERVFPRIVRWAFRLPQVAFSFAYSFTLYLVLIGIGRATTFIYQRF